MARARNIKPSFFTNDELAELNPIGRLLFIGLWTIADREGRLEDRPKKIKAEILPYDSCNIGLLLNELQAHNFILRYEVNGLNYIQIITFTKHQNPHIKEPKSTIPAPDLHHAHQTCTVLAPDLHSTSPADSLLLIPDSPLPIEATSRPDFIPVNLWDGFMEVRKKEKAKNTPLAISLIVRELEKMKAEGIDYIAAIENSIKSSWKDVYPPKGSKSNGGGKSVHDARAKVADEIWGKSNERIIDVTPASN